jgi:hypothetical protein
LRQLPARGPTQLFKQAEHVTQRDRLIGEIDRDAIRFYDRLVMMLEMSVDDTIVLDANEFDQYVRDVWAWTHYDAITLGEYAVGTPVYRKPKRNWDDEEEED